MSLQSHGAYPAVDLDRIHRATDPRLLQPVPAITTTVENANLVSNKEVVTLNRGGSGPRNPILSGLGIQAQLGVGTTDRLLGVWLYQDRRNIGINNVVQAGQAAPGVYSYNFQAGSGVTQAGTPTTGAKRNFIRWRTAFGEVEREFWIKSKDADIVKIADQTALDTVTILAVECVVQIVDATRPWLDVPVDFFVSWNDEFQDFHRKGTSDLENAFLKSYGGAKFVTLFDTTPGTEGVGTAANPFTNIAIEQKNVIEVQNTAGLKLVTFRFRSKSASSYFVDVPVKIRVVAPVTTQCYTPLGELCGTQYIKVGSAIPAETPGIPSTPGVQVVAGTGNSLYDLLVLSIKGNTVGGGRQVQARFWKYVYDSLAVGGAKWVEFGTALNYLPLQLTASGPAPGAPYGTPTRMKVAFNNLQLSNDNIGMITIAVKDGSLVGNAVVFVGPKIRQVAEFAPGGAGGGIVCSY